jgi:2'-5' RNA ligase
LFLKKAYFGNAIFCNLQTGLYCFLLPLKTKMTMIARLFIGVPIESQRVAQQVKTWREDELLNRNSLNWVKPENWHVTLYFLGNQPISLISVLSGVIEESFSGVQSFNALVNGIGVFPHERNAKVLWFGFDDLQPLAPAYLRMGELLKQRGFTFSTQSFKPHLTMARIKRLDQRSSFDSFLTSWQLFDFGCVKMDRIVLYESVSSLQGPVYTPLFVMALENA